MRCVLWLEFSMWICLCTAGGEGVEGGDRKAPPRPQARNPCINTRKQPESVTNPIARKGQGGGDFVPFHSPRFILPCYCSFRSPSLIQPHLRRKKANSSVSTAGENEANQDKPNPVHRQNRGFRAGGNVVQPAGVNANLPDQTASAHAAGNRRAVHFEVEQARRNRAGDSGSKRRGNQVRGLRMMLGICSIDVPSP